MINVRHMRAMWCNIFIIHVAIHESIQPLFIDILRMLLLALAR